MSYEIVCGIDHVWRATSILNKLEHFGLEVLTKGSDLPVARAGPLVDDLIVVSYSEHVLEGVAGEKSDEAVLSW